MAWTEDQRKSLVGQLPFDNSVPTPKPNSFGDAAAASSNPNVKQVNTGVSAPPPASAAASPAPAVTTGPVQRSANIAPPAPSPSTAAPPSSPGLVESSGVSVGTPTPTSQVKFDPATNSYSGGNVSGNVSINGAAPAGGLVSRAFNGESQSATATPAATSTAQSLIDRAFSQPASKPDVPQYDAPVVASSENDWAKRNNLRNLEVSASSITNNGGRFDSRRGRVNGPSLAQFAYQDALRADLTAQGEQPRMDMATNQVNAGLQRAGMDLAGNQQRSLVQAALGQQTNQTELEKAHIAEQGGNQRSLISAMGTVQAAQTKAAADRAPAGYRTAANGNLEAIPGGPADKSQAPLNDVQSKALQFGSRMEESSRNLTRLADQGVTQPGLIKRAADSVGLGMAANWTQSPEQQQVEQSQRDFINAVLRRESGAAIADSEFDNARKQYFPQPGDSQDVIDQKLKNRAIATAGIKAEVPNADQRIGQVIGAGNAAVAAPAGNQQIAELQRRAASDPALAARLKEMGYN